MVPPLHGGRKLVRDGCRRKRSGEDDRLGESKLLTRSEPSDSGGFGRKNGRKVAGEIVGNRLGDEGSVEERERGVSDSEAEGVYIGRALNAP